MKRGKLLFFLTGIKELDRTRSEEVAVLKEIIKGEEVTITPVTHGKCREDKERKKIRDRFELLVNVSILLF